MTVSIYTESNHSVIEGYMKYYNCLIWALLFVGLCMTSCSQKTISSVDQHAQPSQEVEQHAQSPQERINLLTQRIESGKLSENELTSSYFGRGTAYYNLGLYQKAVEDYTAVLGVDSGNPLVYENRGNAFFKMDKLDKAILDYDKLIKLAPRYSSGYLARGLAKNKLCDYEQAILDYSRSIYFDSHNPTAYMLRADTYSLLGIVDQANTDRDRAKRLSSMQPGDTFKVELPIIR